MDTTPEPDETPEEQPELSPDEQAALAAAAEEGQAAAADADELNELELAQLRAGYAFYRRILVFMQSSLEANVQRMAMARSGSTDIAEFARLTGGMQMQRAIHSFILEALEIGDIPPTRFNI